MTSDRADAPEAFEVWRYLWAVAWAECSGLLTVEEVGDLQAEIFEWWSAHGVRKVEVGGLRSWKSWLARRVRWRARDWVGRRVGPSRCLPAP